MERANVTQMLMEAVATTRILRSSYVQACVVSWSFINVKEKHLHRAFITHTSSSCSKNLHLQNRPLMISPLKPSPSASSQ